MDAGSLSLGLVGGVSQNIVDIGMPRSVVAIEVMTDYGCC